MHSGSEIAELQNSEPMNKAVITLKDQTIDPAEVSFRINQASNWAVASKASMKKISAKKIKKKAQKIALPKVTTNSGVAKWKVKTKGKKKVLSLSGGKIKVKKRAKKGVYKIKLQASVAQTANYSGATTGVVTVNVTVK